MNNFGWHRDAGGTVTEKIGLTGFGPNINQQRDPSFGRLSELPGEDPFHAGTAVKFSFSADALALTTADGSRKSYGGVHNMVFNRGNGNDQSVPVTVA